MEMKKEPEIKTENKKMLNKGIEARNELKLDELDLQLGQNSINRLEKVEVYTKMKPVSANQPSSILINSKPPTVPLKTTTQKKTLTIFLKLVQNLKQ